MNNTVYLVAVVAISALITWLTRAAPFLVFGKRALPRTVKYLGSVLPPAIMVILVCYCLRNTDFTSEPYGLVEVISCAAVVIIHKLKNNMYWSIITGTAVYMALIHLL